MSHESSYFKKGRGKSLNALRAEAEGRFPASWWAKKIGRRVQACDIAKALPSSEWHHTGKFAAATYYYSEEEIEQAFDQILACRDARLVKDRAPKLGVYRVRWVDWRWIGSSRHGRWKSSEMSYEGIAIQRREWIHFDGCKKLITGKNIIECTLVRWSEAITVEDSNDS